MISMSSAIDGRDDCSLGIWWPGRYGKKGLMCGEFVQMRKDIIVTELSYATGVIGALLIGLQGYNVDIFVRNDGFRLFRLLRTIPSRLPCAAVRDFSSTSSRKPIALSPSTFIAGTGSRRDLLVVVISPKFNRPMLYDRASDCIKAQHRDFKLATGFLQYRTDMT